MDIIQMEEKIKHIKRIHFIGVGGVSMSALAQIMFMQGYQVSGSDMNQNANTEHLEKVGITVYYGHDEKQIEGAELVVYTAAISPDNCERFAARRQGIWSLERAVFLGLLMRGYQCPIGVAGTHGKTTTTSMLAQIFTEAKWQPTIMVGGNLPSIGGNLTIGTDEYMIFEACEYVDSFLNFYPKVAVILNVEEDHMDYFKDLDQIVTSFSKFAKLTQPDGKVIALCDDENVARAVIEIENLVTCSLTTKNADFYADVQGEVEGRYEFILYQKGKPLGNIRLAVPGIYNVKNALAASATAMTEGISFEMVAKGLSVFYGASRRLEKKGTFNGAELYDDYAHHPTEIAATLAAARIMTKGRLFVVFQPHTYTRTLAFYKDFVRVLDAADQALLLDIYAAREKNVYDVSSKLLADDMENGIYCASFQHAADWLKSHVREGDLVLTMGAGDVYKMDTLLLDGETHA